MKVLVDVNIPRRVCEELRALGFDAVYLIDVLPGDVDDQKILEWMKTHGAFLITRDKKFPETENGMKAVLVSRSSNKLSKEASQKLSVLGVLPV